MELLHDWGQTLSLAGLLVGLFAWLRSDMGKMDARLRSDMGKLEARLSQVEARLRSDMGKLEARLSQVEARLSELAQRVAHVEGQLEGLGLRRGETLVAGD